MSYNIKTIEVFEKQAKKLLKKYTSLKDKLYKKVQELKEDPTQGKSLGGNCYKIRIAIASKGKGKRGGARIITTVFVYEKTVYLLSIYDKSEKDTISDKELQDLLRNIPD
jgi:hypothetical protein